MNSYVTDSPGGGECANKTALIYGNIIKSSSWKSTRKKQKESVGMYRLRAGELYIEFPFWGPGKLTDRVLSGEVYRLFSKDIQNTEASEILADK